MQRETCGTHGTKVSAGPHVTLLKLHSVHDSQIKNEKVCVLFLSHKYY